MKHDKAKALYEKKLAALSAEDRFEVSAFGRFLEDKAKLSPLEMVKKHGDYMGFTTDEIKMLTERLDDDDVIDPVGDV